MNPYQIAWQKLQAILPELISCAGSHEDGGVVAAKAEALSEALEGFLRATPGATPAKDPWLTAYVHLHAAASAAVKRAGGNFGPIDDLGEAIRTSEYLADALGGDLRELEEDEGDL